MKKGRDFSTIYDLTAVRIIVDTVKDCYGALGIVHSIWKPLPGRFKDYIAMPKPNMYQSLHTTVVGPGGDPLEIQIRTLEMHRTSEYGIAAHWRYKEGGKRDDFENKLTWLRSLLEWQNDMRDSRAFMENLKLDLFENQVFVFSPKGDVFSLPAAADAARFRLSGAHRRRPPLRRREGQRQDRAARLPAEERRHLRDAGQQELAAVARLARDRAHLERQAQDQAVVPQGAQRRERRRRPGVASSASWRASTCGVDLARGELIEKIAKRMNYASATDLFAAIGFGDASAASVVSGSRKSSSRESRRPRDACSAHPAPTRARCAQRQRHPHRGRRRRAGAALEVLQPGARRSDHGLRDDRQGRLGPPRRLPERRLHDARRPNAFCKRPGRRRERSRTRSTSRSRRSTAPGLLQDVMGVCAEFKTSASSVTARVKRDKMALISLTLQISNLDHLHKVMEKLRTLRDVRNVYRVTKREARASG